MNKIVTLYLPDLITTRPLPDSSPLAWFLSKADSASSTQRFANHYQRFFSGFGHSIPTAALLANDFDKPKTASFCLASPIEYHVDQKTVYFVKRATHLSEANEKSLLEMLNRFLAEDDIYLQRIDQGIWLFVMKHHTDVFFYDPVNLVGKSMAAYLPTGKDENYWRRLLTECQILLSQQAVSIWFWGNGDQMTELKTAYDAIYTDDVILKAFANHAGIIAEPLPKIWDPAFLQQANQLLIADERFQQNKNDDDPTHYLQQLQVLEQRLIAPLLSSLRKGAISTLKLLTDQKEYILKRRHLYYFWRNCLPCT